jgi:hypothetical protein
MPNDVMGHTVIRIPLGPSEWALVAVPSDRPLPGTAPSSVTEPFIRPQPRKFTLALLPARQIDPNLGLAGVHYCRGQTLTYCLSTLITDYAARVLSGLADRAIGAALSSQPAGQDAGHEPRITIAPAGHDLLAAHLDLGLHPAAPFPVGRDVTILICSNLIAGELAEILTSLWTAHTRYLLHLSRPSMESRPPAPDPVPVLREPADVTGFTGRRPAPSQLPRSRHPARAARRALAGEWRPGQSHPSAG